MKLFSRGCWLALFCLAPATSFAQTAAAIPPASYGNYQAGQFGDRQQGSFGDTDKGEFGNVASGSFREKNFSRAQEAYVRPVDAHPLKATQQAKPVAESPYITLPAPVDQPKKP